MSHAQAAKDNHAHLKTKGNQEMITSIMRHTLRNVAQRLPYLRRFSGRLGLGRWLTSGMTYEQIRIDGDIVIELDLSIPIFKYLYFHHDLSATLEACLIRRLLLPQDIFVDVGANIGYFSLIAAKYGESVLAFEPSPRTMRYLNRNLELNPTLAAKVLVYNIGLSDHAGDANLYNPVDHPGMASLRPIEAKENIIESIQLDTLDHMLGNNVIAFLKIDTEGSELNVLNGAIQSIEHGHPFVLCELFEEYQQRYGHHCKDIVNYFEVRGYQSFHVQEDRSKHSGVSVGSLDLSALSTVEANNALFIATDRVSEVITQLTR